MNIKQNYFDEILTIVQNIIADVTGNELEDVDPTSNFEDDLGITEIDFKRIIQVINSDFDLELDLQEVIEDVETVSELATLIHDESELS